MGHRVCGEVGVEHAFLVQILKNPQQGDAHQRAHRRAGWSETAGPRCEHAEQHSTHLRRNVASLHRRDGEYAELVNNEVLVAFVEENLRV